MTSMPSGTRCLKPPCLPCHHVFRVTMSRPWPWWCCSPRPCRPSVWCPPLQERRCRPQAILREAGSSIRSHHVIRNGLSCSGIACEDFACVGEGLTCTQGGGAVRHRGRHGLNGLCEGEPGSPGACCQILSQAPVLGLCPWPLSLASVCPWRLLPASCVSVLRQGLTPGFHARVLRLLGFLCHGQRH